MLGNLSFYIVVNKNVLCAYIGEGTTLRLECSADQNYDDVHSNWEGQDLVKFQPCVLLLSPSVTSKSYQA